MQKNPKIIIAFLLIAIIALSACLSAKPTSTLQECEEKPSITERDLCYKENAFSKKELTFCTQIIDANIRNNCINDFPS